MTLGPVVAPIVEGHGEVNAVRRLITRIGTELCGTWIEVAQPFRLDAAKMRKPDELAKAIRVQAARVPGRGGVLVVRHGDDRDAPCPVEPAGSLKPATRPQGCAPAHHSGTRRGSADCWSKLLTRPGANAVPLISR